MKTGKIKLLTEKRLVKKIKLTDELELLFNKRLNISIAINKNEEDEDPIDAFFKTMALTVKSFPQNLKIKVKKEVFKMIRFGN